MAVDQDSSQEREKFDSGLPWWHLVPVLIVPVGLFAVGLYTPITIPRDNIRTFLMTLVRAESSIIAIIFSVMFLGVQIISSRYTSRMSQLFFRDRLLQVTIILLGLAIALDLALLYLLPTTVSKSFLALVLGSVGLSIVAVYSLLLSVRRMLVSSTPEGVIYTASNSIDLEDFIKSSDASNSEAPPTRGLFSFTIGSLSSGELLTAQKSFQEFIHVINRTSTVLSQQPGRVSSQEFRSMFHPVFCNQLPGIYIAALREGERQIQRQSLACQRQLAQSLCRSNPKAAKLAMIGFRKIVEQLRGLDEDDGYAEAEVIEQSLGLIRFVVKNHDEDSMGAILSQYREFLTRLYDGENMSETTRQVLFQHLPDIHYQLISDGVVIEGENWRNKSIGDLPTDSKSSLAQLYLILTQVSTVEGLGQESVTVSAECWSQIHMNLTKLTGYSRSETPSIRKLIIEISLIQTSKGPESSGWEETISKVCYWGSPNEVEDTFDRFIEEQEIERTEGLYQSSEDEGVHMMATEHFFSVKYYNLLTYAERLKERAFNKYKSLVWDRGSLQKIRNVLLSDTQLIEDGLSVWPAYSPQRDRIGQWGHLIVSQRAQLGHDGLVMMDKDMVVTLVKVVKSINIVDRNEMENLRANTYFTLQSRILDQVGPIQLRFIVITPNAGDDTIRAFKERGIEIRTLDPQSIRYSIGRQTSIDDFRHSNKRIQSCSLVDDELEFTSPST